MKKLTQLTAIALLVAGLVACENRKQEPVEPAPVETTATVSETSTTTTDVTTAPADTSATPAPADATATDATTAPTATDATATNPPAQQ